MRIPELLERLARGKDFTKKSDRRTFRLALYDHLDDMRVSSYQLRKEIGELYSCRVARCSLLEACNILSELYFEYGVD